MALCPTIITPHIVIHGELFTQIISIIKERYQKTSLRELSKAQKLDLARTLHYDFRCSNGQLRRVIGLTQYEVDALFPKSATSSLCNNEIII